MAELVISVMGKDEVVKATIRSKPGRVAAVLDILEKDPRAGPGVLLDKALLSIPSSEDMLQPDDGPFKYLLKHGRLAQRAGHPMTGNRWEERPCCTRFAAHLKPLQGEGR